MAVPKTLEMFKGDTLPAVRIFLRDKNRVPINLSGKTVVARFLGAQDRVKFTRECVLTNSPGGECELRWQKGDTDVRGDYTLEIVVYFAADQIQTAGRVGVVVK